MNQHLVATYSLSLLIVVAFAITFYRADPPPKSRQAAGVESRVAKSAKSIAQAARKRAPDAAKVDAGVTLTHKVDQPTRGTVTATAISPKPPLEPTTRSVSHVRSVPRMTRSAFTTVNPDESLDDVARRVYGTAEESERLWKANRDQLESTTSSLRVGMLLRTP